MDKIGYTLYKYIIDKNYDKIKNIIENQDLNEILLHNGCLSNIILYYINYNDIININKILLRTNLMKRDYLNISKYFYDINFDKSLLIFKNINYKKLNTKDIDFLINNKLIKLIYELNELFIYTKININLCKLSYIKLKIKNTYINQINKYLTLDIINNLYKIINNYEYIIDAGNILHSDKGSITPNSINGLIKIMNNYKNSLIIIHKKHFNNLYIKNIIIKYNYYLTPYNYNDDLFILWFFFNNNCNIITNDKFKDHNYNLNLDYDYNILLQYIIHYSNNYDLYFKEYNFIRKCDNNIYIPYDNNDYVCL